MGNTWSAKKNEVKRSLQVELQQTNSSRPGSITGTARKITPLLLHSKVMAPGSLKLEPSRIIPAGIAGGVTSIGGGNGAAEADEVITGGSRIDRDQSGPLHQIPQHYLNDLGFINYNHYGCVPWSKGEDGFLSVEYTSVTPFLGIDCEMVGVGHLKNSALGRVSIVNEYGFCIYDRFVKPKEEISDYRTEFSGIRHEDLVYAHSIDRVLKKVKEIVEGKVLVGHSIHNDLEVLGLNDHPRTRDTSIFFQRLLATKQTPSLKSLTTKYLEIDIQGGEHSSIQDAQATLKLYLKFRDDWEQNLAERREKANITEFNLSNQFMAPPIDITEMNVCPREKDVFADSNTIFLRENRSIGSYSSSEEYKDVQFRLLLEDLFRPLREGVINAQQFRGRKKGKTPKAGTIFNGISIQGHNVEVKGKKHLMVPIDYNNLRTVDWEESKMFLPGSLLLLSPDNFKRVKFATITWRPENNKEVPPDRRSFPLAVQFCRDGPSWITEEGNTFQMMESPAYYEAYRHTLEYLQVINLNSFPMKKYIVDAVTYPCLPKYLQNVNVLFDFSVFMNDTDDTDKSQTNNYKVLPLAFDDWPNADQLKLDPSQYEAFQKAVTQELTIIQGPPGTGKTFIGLQVAKFFLKNPWLLKSPILIVSYTNHSLDQILEGLLHFVTEAMCDGNEFEAHRLILRIGGQSKSKIVEPLLLRYKIDQNRARKRYEGQLVELLKTMNSMNDFETGLTDGILDFLQLPPPVIQQLAVRCKNIWMKWKNELIKIQQNPSDWFGIQKRNPPVKNRKKNNRMVLLPFRDFELTDEALSEILRTLHPVYSWNEDLLKKNFITAFETQLPLLYDTYMARLIIYISLVNNVQKIVLEMKIKVKQLEEFIQPLKWIQGRAGSIASAKIIGMTTTGAVKNKKIVLNSFKSQVMIVEEAAHVLEAHVVASLTNYCQQMIMIGDHKQLRPMTADHGLAKDYKLELSLMERLVQNGVSQGKKNWVQLRLQHRMRPEIARMVCPVIYDDLENHPIVFKYPDVKGCTKNLFFMDHTMEEEREHRSCSLINHHEARFLSQLCRYFITTGGYDQSQITIIATYLDQKLLLQKKLAGLPGCGDVKISTVDGYQGEENDIILLSLVRSNHKKVVGFLKTDNRVCVALSRARHGLFMMGNMSCLKESSDTWTKINDILQENNNIGTQLLIKCPRHGHTSGVSIPEDFTKRLCPDCTNGAVRQGLPVAAFKYNSKISTPRSSINFQQLPAMAIATTNIESTSSHTSYSRVVPLQRIAQPSSKKLPKCGHEYLGKQKQLDIVKCIVVVRKKLPCGHIRKAPCHQREDMIKCDQWALKTLPCGHDTSVEYKCYEQISNIKCIVVVRKKLPCGHIRKAPCHQREDVIKCDQGALKTLPCGHSTSDMFKCYEKISNIKCIVVVKKQLPCGHIRKAPCHQREDVIKCDQWALKTLPCGHATSNEFKCYEKIPEIKCIVPVPKSLPCGHIQNIHCHIDVSNHKCQVRVDGCKDHQNVSCYRRSTIICNNLVRRLLQCGHETVTSCSKVISEIKCISTVLKSLPCKHQQNAHCHLAESKIICNKRVELCEHLVNVPCHQRFKQVCKTMVKKNLPCGHTYQQKLLCNQKVPKTTGKCKILVPVALPLPCKHNILLECHEKDRSVAGIPCTSKCKKKFDCGHFCCLPCHIDNNPNHEEQICTEKCRRSCPKGHGCPGDHLCHTSCKVQSQCPVKITDLMRCGHFQHTPCHEYNAATKDKLEEVCELCSGLHNLYDTTLKSFSSFKI